MIQKYLFGTLVAVVLLGGVFVGSKYPLRRSSAVFDGAHLSASSYEYDFGKVLQSGGVVSTNFDVHNDGNQDVVITNTPASCSCTSATIDKKILKPGEHTNLTVMFDPNYHYEDDGRFFRTVTIESNAQKELEVKIWVEVDYDLGKDKLKFLSEKSRGID